jgi:CHAD domain-containing protein
MQTQLQRYFSQRVKHLFNYLHEFELTGSEVSLHDFRIEMKKLKAIIKFLRSVYPKQKFKKASHSLRNIFQSAGEIREYQILQQWMHKIELPTIEKNYFPNDKMDVMIKAFHARSGNFKLQLKEIVEFCTKFIQTTNSILAEQYVVELYAQIDKILKRAPSMSDWHELRKIIKQWMYAINWLPQNTETDVALSYYNKLQEAIGQWHDLEVIKDTFTMKQIYLSSDMNVQKDFSKAWDKLHQSLRYREKIVEDILSKTPVTAVPEA